MAANGIEVASTYVTVLAKMPGLTASVDKALGRVDVGAASKKIGQQVAESVGKSLKDQVAKKFADATAAALDKQTQSTKKLSDAEHALVKARSSHGSSSAKLSAAEEKLEKLRSVGKATAAQLEQAEAAVEKARADTEGTRRAVAASQNKVAEATRNAAEASREHAAAVERESSKVERISEWTQLAGARMDEMSGKWKSAGEKISGVGSSLTSKFTKPATLAAGAVTGLVTALGFKRLIGIDTARGQFKGLGMDADAVMAQVDRGVTNTSLSMAQGASLAVGILATGTVPLEGLEAQIKRVSNVSAAYGVEAEHAAYLLNNVLTKNKVTWGDLSQMQQNQIPIVTQLADYYGVAGDEIMKMAQDGAISVEDLNKVLDQNAGAAAEEYANTWQGVTANILSNIGRIGAKFLEPSFELMKDEAAEFLDFLKTDEFSTFATDMGDRIAGMVTTVSEKIQDLIGWWMGLTDGQRKFIGVAAGVLVAAGPVLTIVGKLVSAVGLLISAGKLLLLPFKAIPAVWGAAKLAQSGWNAAAVGGAGVTKALTGATKGQTVAMKVGAAAQRVFNATLKANPIGLIITAITTLVAGLVWFFAKTELGQKVWGEFTRFLGEAWANITGFFTAAYENVIKPVFDAIGVVAKWVFESILVPVFKLVQLHFAVMAGIFQGIWDFILKPIFDAIGVIFTWLYGTVIKPIIDGIVLYFRIWGMIFQWLWATAVKPVFDSIGKIFNWILQTIIKPTVDQIKLHIQAAGMVFSWLWVNAVKPAIDNVGRIFNWLYTYIIKPVWDGISRTISDVWNNKIKPVIDTLSKVVSTDPKKAFEAARDGIHTAWTAIQDLAKKPVKFVIETVINGLIDTINKIPGVNLKKVPLPKGFAQGGVLPGYNAQKKDTILTPMRAGEGVLVPEVVRGLGAGFVHGLNAAGNRGGVGAVRSAFGGMIHPGRAKGGLIHPLPGCPYSSGFGPRAGGFHNGLDIAAPTGATIRSAGAGTVESAGWSDYGGGNQVIVNHANGLQTWYAHMSQILTKTGAKVRAGATLGKVGSTGNSTGPHLHYMVLNNGWPNYVNPMPFLGGGGAAPGGQAGGGGWNPLGDMIDGISDWATGKFKDAFPGSDMFVDMAAGLMKQGVGDAVKWAKSLIGIDSVGNTGKPLLYDNGGWLKPGLSMVENRTGRPEPILNPSQWDAVSRGGLGGFPSQVRLAVGDREFDAYVEELADGRVGTALSAAVPRRLNDTFGVR